ncbi:MAG TPA: porphyrin biosynthesis protein [Spirochaetia bacterium]|nr:MAG: porphyrin biosynthesis protein [Spirochaetes bacterium GWB1_36_13]HCL57143.1 porphyrin biosynthesis protein [Spirochaetia bacterium]
MIFLPVCLNITGKKILIIGGGKAAVSKLKVLEMYSDQITILAKEISSELKKKKYSLIEKEFDPEDLKGYYLVYGCTNNIELNQTIFTECEKNGILVNVCDNPPLSHFTSPALIKKDNMSIAVSSNAENVKKSIEWRNYIKDFLKNDFI